MKLARPVLFLALLALLISPAPAAGEDDAPVYGASDLALEDEGVAEGWEIAYEDVEGTPGEALEGWATGVAMSIGIEEDALYCETRILRGPEGVGATVLLVELEGDAKGCVAALADRGKPLEYVVRSMGDPSRILVVAAPAAVRQQVLEMEVAYAVSTLARLGAERLASGSRLGAEAYAMGALGIDPKAGPALVVLGMIAVGEEKWDEGIESLRAAFGPAASIKPQGRLAMLGYGQLGLALLQKKEASLDREAREAFEKSVALFEHAGDGDQTFVHRYNLACAHARLREVDEALFQLEKSLEEARRQMPAPNYQMWVKRHVATDEDFANIKDHPGFAAILAKASGGAGGGGHPGGI